MGKSTGIKFGTDGWRAVIAEDFTFANVEKATYAIGLYLKSAYPADVRTVLLGYDTRFLAEKFAERAGAVLAAMGFDCKLSDRDIPTPAIAWATQASTTCGAIQFTASHNPPEYCGLKYIPHYAGPATNDITSAITANLNLVPTDLAAQNGFGSGYQDVHLERFDIVAPYLEAVLANIDVQALRKAKLKVGFDALYSTSRGYLDRALEACGVAVHTIHDHVDPLFGGGMPEPKPKYLKGLAELIQDKNLDAGVATDGDADRFAFVGGDGRFFTANECLCLLAHHLYKNKNMRGALVRNICTSHMLDHVAQKQGLELIETPVGFKYIGEQMRLKDVLLGGEESGGVSIKGHIPEKDGILANLLLLEAMAIENKSMTQLWADLERELGVVFYQVRSDIHLTDAQQKRVLQELDRNPVAQLAGKTLKETSRKDGIKMYVDHDHWILVRPSGTEPILRLSGEGTDKKMIQEMMLDFERQIDEILKVQVEIGINH